MLLGLVSGVFAQQDTITVHLFYGQGCPHCAHTAEALDILDDELPIHVVSHEIYFNTTERALFLNVMDHLGQKVEGVPTLVIGEHVVVGYRPDHIKTVIQECMNKTCADVVSSIENEGFENASNASDVVIGEVNQSEYNESVQPTQRHSLTISAVVSAALVDAINPCAFAVLIILLTTVLATSQKKRALGAGLAFSLSVFISYYFMGVGLYSAIRAAQLSHLFFGVVAVLAILIGLFNLKDYLWYGKWFVMEVPMSWRPKLKALLRGVTSVPGAFGVGFLVSLFLLPCTSGPYIVILGLLSHVSSRSDALWYLVLYNAIFILPMVLITLAVYFGRLSTERAEELRQRKLQVLHLIAGIILLALGVGMLVAMWLGKM